MSCSASPTSPRAATSAWWTRSSDPARQRPGAQLPLRPPAQPQRLHPDGRPRPAAGCGRRRRAARAGADRPARPPGVCTRTSAPSTYAPSSGSTTISTSGPSKARAAAAGIAELGIPVFLYGELASDEERRERAFFRRGGPAELARRMGSGELQPDLGPRAPHPGAGSDAGDRAAAPWWRSTWSWTPRIPRSRERSPPGCGRRGRPARGSGAGPAARGRAGPGLDQRPRRRLDPAGPRGGRGAAAGGRARGATGRGRACGPGAGVRPGGVPRRIRRSATSTPPRT